MSETLGRELPHSVIADLLPEYRVTEQGVVVYAERVGFDDVRTGPRAYFLSAWTRTDGPSSCRAIRFMGCVKLFKLRDKTAALAAVHEAFPEYVEEQEIIRQARELSIPVTAKLHLDL